jgi:hypothetical protein
MVMIVLGARPGNEEKRRVFEDLTSTTILKTNTVGSNKALNVGVEKDNGTLKSSLRQSRLTGAIPNSQLQTQLL